MNDTCVCEIMSEMLFKSILLVFVFNSLHLEITKIKRLHYITQVVERRNAQVKLETWKAYRHIAK